MSGNTYFDAEHKAGDFIAFFSKAVTSVLKAEDDMHVGATLCLKGWCVLYVPNQYVSLYLHDICLLFQSM